MRSRDNICKFCSKGFSSERTLIAHMCPKKRRFADKDQPGSLLGFRVYQRFYEFATTAPEPRTFMEFIFSPHYMAFVKFARYVIDLGPLSSDRFIDHVIKNGIKMKQWNNPDVYEKWLVEHLRKEPVAVALERGVLTMDAWATEQGLEYTDFYSKVHTVEAVQLIRSGKLSPWVLYVSENSTDLLGRMNAEQNKILFSILDVNMWNFVFHKRLDDVRFAKEILGEAGL